MAISTDSNDIVSTRFLFGASCLYMFSASRVGCKEIEMGIPFSNLPFLFINQSLFNKWQKYDLYHIILHKIIFIIIQSII